MDLPLSERFRELKQQLQASRYQVTSNALFEQLCYLHNYITETKDVDAKNEFVKILHDIFIEIFMPLREPTYRPYPQGERFYFGSYITLYETINLIFDLNPYSKIWLKDISEYYLLYSDSFLQYNAIEKIDFSKGKIKVYGDRNTPAIRTHIMDHLRIYVDPEKPLPPKTDNPTEHYLFRFESALYEENKLKNRFFQSMKYKEFMELQQDKVALCNLSCTELKQEEIYDEEEELNSWVMKLVPKQDYWYKYPLFKDNPAVYIYAYTELGIFNPQLATFHGKVISINEDENYALVRFTGKRIEERTKMTLALVLRPDYQVFNREREALYQFKQKADAVLHKAVVLQQPQIEKNKPSEDKTAKNKLSDLSLFNSNLNPSQQEAVQKALCASNLFCIHGPPGTGKTKVCTEILLQQLYLFPKSRVLVSCASDEAVDNILAAFKRVLPEELYHLILRLGGKENTLNNRIKESTEYREKIVSLQSSAEKLTGEANTLREQRKQKEQVLQELRMREANFEQELQHSEHAGQLLDEHDKIKTQINELIPEIIKLRFAIDELNRKEKEVREIIISNQEKIKQQALTQSPLFIFTTNSHAAALQKYRLEFDLLVEDEVTQSTEPSVLIPLNLSKKIVMAGDHHQLPPTVFLKNKNYDEDVDPQQESVRIKSYQILSKSIFERLYDTLPKVFLARQYRMHPLLVEFLNQTIYPGLVCDKLVYDYTFTSSLFGKALVFINHETKEEKSYVSEEFSPSRAEYNNPEEVHIVENLVRKYLASGVNAADIGVISPYNAQVRELNKVLESLGVVAKTIDRFQGQEKKVIILSLVRCNDYKSATESLGFLVDERRFNVAITRFQYELIIIGNASTLSGFEEYNDLYEGKKKPIYYPRLVEFIRQNGLYVEKLDKYLSKTVNFVEAPRKFVDKIDAGMQKELVNKVKL